MNQLIGIYWIPAVIIFLLIIIIITLLKKKLPSEFLKNLSEGIKNVSIFIGKALHEKDGKPSLTRILTLYVVVFLTLCLGVGFILICIYYPQHITEFVWAMSAIILGSLGIKGWQSVKQTTIASNTEI